MTEHIAGRGISKFCSLVVVVLRNKEQLRNIMSKLWKLDCVTTKKNIEKLIFGTTLRTESS